MNKKLINVLFASCVLAIIVIASCKKTSDTDPVIDQSCKAIKIEDYTEKTLNNTYNLTYDATNRLIQRAGTKNTSNITYDTDKVTVTGTNSGSLDITLKAGVAVKVAGVGTTNYEEYTYTNGYITTVQYYEAGILKSTYTLSYSGGNLVGIVRKDVGWAANQTDVTAITYSSTPTNSNLQFAEPFNTVVSHFDAPYRIYGNMSAGIVTKMVNTQTTVTGAVTNQTITTNDYTYARNVVTDSSSPVDQLPNYVSIGIVKNVKTLTGTTTNTEVVTNLKYSIAYGCK